MSKRFMFVCGDIGGAELQCRVLPILLTAGHSVGVIADPAGLGSTIFQKNGIPVSKVSENIECDADCFFIGTCGTANGIEAAMARKWHGKKPVVFASDGFFNHGLREWRDAQADYWCAINESHAVEIRERHPSFTGKIVVTGQPAFDDLPRLYLRKEARRSHGRNILKLTSDHRLMVWWSQGTHVVLEEDIEMVCAAIRAFGNVCRSKGFIPACIPMIHPKVEKIKAGYIADITARVHGVAKTNNVHILSRDLSIPLDELNFAADLVCAITSTEEIKSTLAGGPAVIHFLGPAVRQWFLEDLGRIEPYLPDIVSGQSLGAYDLLSLHSVVTHAFDASFAHTRLQNWSPPAIDDAASRIARLLMDVSA